MQFHEFKDWFDSTDARLDGRAPDIKLWWELKARLAAVTPEVASSPGAILSPPALPAQPDDSRQAEPIDTAIADFPADAGPIDPEPGDFTQLSREKDGGLMAEAVATLRGRRRA